MLTATPEQLGRAGHFARLRLLDPTRYHDYDAFLAEESKFEIIADNLDLLLTEASVHYNTGDVNKSEELYKFAVDKNPLNPELYYNLGVVSADLGEKDDAISYYEKSIDLDPTNENSYLNLVALILEGEQDIVSQMNSLGTSRSDNLKYDQLKESRENLYKQCIPILKDLIAINNNIEAIRTLMNIYGTIGDNAGYMEMKNLLEQQD